jgi:hypothetical protein
MKKIFIITTVSTAALLGACGSTASTSKTSPAPTKVAKTKTHVKTVSYGFNANDTVLTLPYVGQASPTITKFAAQDNGFYKEIINPADWVKSKTFGQYIFVGPYTTGVSYQRIRDAKIAAVNSMELFTLDASYSQTWPSVLNGFNYDAFGQGPVSRSLLASFYKSAVAQGQNAMKPILPSEATIVESPVGSLTAAQMANGPGQPQNTTLGTCIPHAFEVKYSNGNGYAIKSGQFLGATNTQEYFADYGDTNIVLPNSNTFSSGVGSNPVNSCANFS